ncbi:MAG TPA: radical SAM protein [Pyrodictiaceae archaeon]|nr:radical SAM protein [Pyrodictiaceae archaeon]
MRLRNGKIVRAFDPWKSPLCTCPPKYSLQPYTGCSHFCLYCYATAYIGRKPSTPKQRALERLKYDIEHVVDPKYHIDLSTSSDPYPPEEAKLKLTRKMLELLIAYGLKVLIVTKSSLVARDTDILSKGNVAVTITITTLDKNLAKAIEPGAPHPKERVKAIEQLVTNGVPVGVRLDPLIPYLNDDRKDVRSVLEAVASAGARFIVTSTYKARPDNLRRLVSTFPELEEKYYRLYRIEGKWQYGYWYLRPDIRRQMLGIVQQEASRLDLQFAVCREGFKDMLTAPSCDGSHLIPRRIEPKKRGDLLTWLEKRK